MHFAKLGLTKQVMKLPIRFKVKIMVAFDETNSWNLPSLKDGKFAGIISKLKL